MPKDKNIPSAADNNDITPDYDMFSDDKTKEIVGNLFDEFVEEGETNYFAGYSDPFLDSETEDDESLKDSISRRRQRNITSDGKSIVIRKKAKKAKSEDEYNEDNSDENDSSEPMDLEKTIVLPKLSQLFKKNDKDESEDDVRDDDEIDEFFENLKKDSAARSQAAAASEIYDSEPDGFEEEPAKEGKPASRPDDYTDEDAQAAPRRSKNKRNKKRKKSKAAAQAPAEQAVQSEPEYTEPVQDEPADAYNDYDEPEYTEPPRKTKKPKKIKPEKPQSEPLPDDEENEGEKLIEISLFKVITIAAVVILLVIATALTYKCHSLKKQLTEARQQITELQKSSSSTLETEIDELKKKNTELTNELESIKADGSAATDPHTAAVEILNEAQSEITTSAPNANLSQSATGGNTYTVKAGDTFWKISQSVYGNGADYQRILSANNLTESSKLHEGQVLTIPN